MANERRVLKIDRDIERKFRFSKLYVEIKSSWTITAGMVQDETPDQPKLEAEESIKLIESSAQEVIEVPVEDSTKVKVSR